jgi:hypothetical protein
MSMSTVLALAAFLLETAALVSLPLMRKYDPNAPQLVWPSLFWAAGVVVGVATLIVLAFRPTPPAWLLVCCAWAIAIGLTLWALNRAGQSE